MQKQLEPTVFITIGVAMASLMVNSSALIEQDVNAQNMTNASRLTGVENDSSEIVLQNDDVWFVAVRRILNKDMSEFTLTEVTNKMQN